MGDTINWGIFKRHFWGELLWHQQRLVRLAKKLGVSLRQSYRRVGKLALIKHPRYAHAHQFKRANKSLRKLKTYLGRVIRDIERHIVGNEGLQEAFVRPLYLARRVLEQERRQRGRKVYPRGRVHRQGQGTPALRVRGQGERRHHREAFRRRPVRHPCRSIARLDGHTLGTVIPHMEALIGNVLDRCITDAGYRGHNAPSDHKFKVYTTGQKRRVTPQIKREFKRRAAIEPVIGPLKEHYRMGRNHLAHASGDAINAVLAAAG
jgi:IS5 family transposase